jgi:hypothetical protein
VEIFNLGLGRVVISENTSPAITIIATTTIRVSASSRELVSLILCSFDLNSHHSRRLLIIYVSNHLRPVHLVLGTSGERGASEPFQRRVHLRGSTIVESLHPLQGLHQLGLLKFKLVFR